MGTVSSSAFNTGHESAPPQGHGTPRPPTRGTTRAERRQQSRAANVILHPLHEFRSSVAVNDLDHEQILSDQLERRPPKNFPLMR